MRMGLRIGRERPLDDFYDTADRLRKWEFYRVSGREFDIPRELVDDFKRDARPYTVSPRK